MKRCCKNCDRKSTVFQKYYKNCARKIAVSESIIKTERFRTPVFKKYGKNCSRNHGSVSKACYKPCAQDFLSKSMRKTVRATSRHLNPIDAISTILQSEPLTLKHFWGKIQFVCLFSLAGQWDPIDPVWALAAIHLVWGNRYFQSLHP